MPIPYLKPKKTKSRKFSPSARSRPPEHSAPAFKKRIVSTGAWHDHRDAWHRRSAVYKHSVPSSFKQKLVTVVLVGGILAAVSSAGALVWLLRDLPDPQNIATRPVPQSTRIYDRTGQLLLYEIHGAERRTNISLGEVPDHMKWATLVAEDRDFYRHGGIKFRSIIRAILTNIVSGDLTAQGASTITQQFIKNAVLTTEKKYSRKIKEIVLAWRIERSFTKDEILEMYFNEIPYGSVAYGVQAAAEIYFGKSARDLTLPEAAILAAMAKAPTYYSPYGSNKDQLIARQHFVIDGMREEGYISETVAQEAKATPLQFQPPRGNIAAPHFVMYVRQLLAEKYGEKIVEQGGLRVTTTLDISKQGKAEDAVREWTERNEKEYKATNAALVALDPKTGEILAMIGSWDYFDDEHDGQVNVALRPRQPGSSFKPMVYAAAFQQGLSPDTILFDVVTKFKTDTGKDYEPHNYTGKEYGPVTIRQALAGSLNIPAVKTIYLAGIGNVIDLAERLGYTTFTDRSRFGLSLVLGGGEVKLLEHVSAFSAFARDGIHHTPVAVVKVEDERGAVLEEFKPDDGQLALDSFVVRQINSILTDNDARAYIFGEKNYLTLGARPVAAKTGTTNDFRDAWAVGYTPSLAAGVWVGNNDFSEMRKGADGAAVAAPIWNAFMKSVLGNTPIEQFKTASAVPLPEKPMLNGNMGDEQVIKINRVSGKRASEFTPPELIEERKFVTIHTILHYVTPGNILGPAPSNPTRDPNYAPWEEAVQRWAKEHAIPGSAPPTEYDDASAATPPQPTEETQPSSPPNQSVQVTKPAPGAIIPQTAFPYALMLSFDSSLNIEKVDFYIRPAAGTALSQWIGFRENPIDTVISFIWEDTPLLGRYVFYAVITERGTRRVTKTEEIEIEIIE